MKNLFFILVLFTVFSGTSFSAVAQKNKRSNVRTPGILGSKPVKFIEGIEIKADPKPHSEPDNAVINTNVSTGLINTTKPDIEKSVAVQFKYAQILNCNVESITNLQLFKFIEEWWAAHYRYGGTTKDGVDCSAFSGLLFSNVYGIEIPRTAKEQYDSCEKIRREKMTEGDLVFFNTRGGVSHVGIYLGDGYFVHASISNGVTINNLDDDYYSARFLGGGRILHVSNDGIVKTGLR